MPREFIPHPTFLVKLWYLFILYICKVTYRIAELLLPYTPLRHLAAAPTFTKSYPTHPDLPVWFYLPTATPPPGTRYPLYIDIHGGGFLYGTPFKDSGYNRRVCSSLHCVVAAISYRKAPKHRHPAQLHDVQQLIREILGDKTLPIDAERVVVGGFSAGAILALTIDIPVKAVVAWYPRTDYTLTHEEQGDKGGARMKWFGRAFDWAHLDPVTRCDDDQVSAKFRAKESWRRVMVVCGAEDRFARECEAFMQRWQVETRDCEGYTISTAEGGRVVGMIVEGVGHAFTHRMPMGSGEEAIKKRVVTNEVIDRVVEWVGNVFEGVL